MTDGGRARSSVLAVSGAGAAFAIGAVAVIELLSLALPGPRGAFLTWGPVLTVSAGAAIVVIGLPASLLVEAATRRAGAGAAVALGGYLAAAVAAGLALWGLWRAVVDADAAIGDLFAELVALGLGSAAIWAGARLAERVCPALPFLFGVGALVAVTVAAALAHA